MVTLVFYRCEDRMQITLNLMSMQNSKIFSALLIVVSLLSGFVGGLFSSRFVPLEELTANESAMSENSTQVVSDSVFAIKKVEPAVVSVKGYKIFDKAPDKPVEVSGGTGFIVTEGGFVLTNKHVVGNEELTYKVLLQDGKEYDSTVISRDPFDDVAVLQIKGEAGQKFPVATLGDSDKLEVGQRVLAIGNALSIYENTVTEGIVSAKARDITAATDLRGGSENLSGLIQTDAAINFGNSGGPLFNLDGEVIGMNVAVAQAANGIGFAIPIDDLKPVISSVEKFGEIVRPVLGVRFVMLTPNQSKAMDIKIEQGALLIGDILNGEVAIIADGPAEKAGLKAMDVILSVDGKDLSIENPLHKVVRRYEPGQIIKLKVWRNGEVIEKNLTLGNSKDFERK